MQLDGAEEDVLPEEASSESAADKAQVKAERDSRKASHQQASPSGQKERSPEDDAIRRFDNIVDDWLVRTQSWLQLH